SFYKTKVDEFSNIATADQTIDEGVERTLNVEGKLNITGLEDVEERDLTFNKKIVIDHNGTLAMREDANLVINLSVPATTRVEHAFPNWAKPNDFQQELQNHLEHLLEGWRDTPADFWEGKTINNQHPEVVQVREGEVVVTPNNVLMDLSYEQNQNTPACSFKTREPIFKQGENFGLWLHLERSKGFNRGSTGITMPGTKPLSWLTDGNSNLQRWAFADHTYSQVGICDYYFLKIANALLCIAIPKFPFGLIARKVTTLTFGVPNDDNFFFEMYNRGGIFKTKIKNL
ncbi:hypothetical protein EDL98_11680, partial [Ornithobacterium rhinotracheale]|uniref:hypothetical protein n=1 Tax=Ornithobacterium rhinotracheale TaxID=28251 RepID=UPI0016235EF6